MLTEHESLSYASTEYGIDLLVLILLPCLRSTYLHPVHVTTVHIRTYTDDWQNNSELSFRGS